MSSARDLLAVVGRTASCWVSRGLRGALGLDELEEYMVDADLRWHAMLDERGYPPLDEAA